RSWVRQSGTDRFSISSRSGSNRLGLCFIGSFTISAFVNGRDFLDPAAALRVLQVHDCLDGPVEVIGYEGYLLIQRLERVAYNPPSAFISTSKVCEHSGQTAPRLALPLRLMRL